MNAAILWVGVTAGFTVFLVAKSMIRTWGRTQTVAFYLWVLAYGVFRDVGLYLFVGQGPWAVWPYIIRDEGLNLGPVHPIELLGWCSALALAWAIGRDLLVRLGINATMERISLVAALVMTCLAWSVERSAQDAGWWMWTLKRQGRLPGQVPWIAILDWGFVALEALMPFLTWKDRRGLKFLILTLFIFPVHFLSHRVSGVLWKKVPVSLFDIVHTGIPFILFAGAIHSKEEPVQKTLEASSHTKVLVLYWVAVMVALELLVGYKLYVLWTVLPLLILGILLLVKPRSMSPRRGRFKGHKSLMRKGVVLAALGFTLFILALRIPYHRKNIRFLEIISEGVIRLNQGQPREATDYAVHAQNLRPDHPAGFVLQAMALWNMGQTEASSKILEHALFLQPTNLDALRLAGELQLQKGHWQKAEPFFRLGCRVAPNRLDFQYLWLLATSYLGIESKDIEHRFLKLWDKVKVRKERERWAFCRLVRNYPHESINRYCAELYRWSNE